MTNTASTGVDNQGRTNGWLMRTLQGDPDAIEDYRRRLLNTGKLSTGGYEWLLKDMYDSQMQDYFDYTQPMIDELQKESKSTAIVDESRRQADRLGAASAEVFDRQQGYSMGDLLPSQRAAAKKQMGREVAKGRTAMMTQAHADQRNSNQAARVQLMSISEQLQQSGTASMSQAFAAKKQRDEAYKGARKGFASQALGAVGAVVGGYYGGAYGATAGASIGSTVGSAIG